MQSGGPKQRRLWEGYSLSALSAALLSSKAIFIKLAYQEHADAVLMLAGRMLIALPFFLGIGLVGWWRWQGPRPSLATIMGAVLTGFVISWASMILDFAGLLFISARLERLVLFTYPLFVMLLGAAFFGGSITRYGLAGMAVTFAGLALVFGSDMRFGGGWNTLAGTGLVLACAIVFAFYVILAKRYIMRLGSLVFTGIAFSATAVSCLLHYGVTSYGIPPPDLSWRYLGLVTTTALVATVIPALLGNAGLARISATSASMIATVSPLVTIVLAVIFLHEPFGLVEAVGACLMIVGIGGYTWADARAAASARIPVET